MVLLTLGGFIASSILLATLFPSIVRMNDAIASDRAGLVTQTREEITLVNAFSELDAAAAWQDTESDTLFDVWMWVKNTGAVRIIALQRIDVFFGPETAFDRIPYGGAGCTAPCWEYELENDTEWNSTATLHITIYLEAGNPLAAGNTYYIKVVTPNGIEDSKFFTL